MKNCIKRVILCIIAAVTLCSCQSMPYDEEMLPPLTEPVEGGDIAEDPPTEKAWIIPDQSFTWHEGGDTDNQIYSRPMRSLHVYDGALYYFSNLPVRYHPQTDVQTALCSDPLCSHDGNAKCPFYGIREKILLENYVILRREPSDFRYPDTVELLDLNDLTLRSLREISGTLTVFGGEVVCGDVYVYVNLVYDEHKDTRVYELCRKNMKSGKVEVLRRDPTFLYVPLFVMEDTIYYSCSTDDLIYAAPMDDLLRMSPVAQVRGRWFLDRAEDCFYSLDPDTGTVYRSSSPDMAQSVLAVDGMDYFYMTDQHIYYRRVHGQAEETTFYGEPAYQNLYEYFCCDRDGGNARLIYREEYKFGAYTYFLRDFVVLGNYLYAPWTMQMFDGEVNDGRTSDKNINSTLVRIDLESGEWYYIMNE